MLFRSAKELDMKLDKIQEVMGKMNLSSVLSLDMVMEETQEKQKVSSLMSLDFAKQPEEKYLENEFREVLKDGINSLKEKEKLVISLYYVEELNMKEIASVMHTFSWGARKSLIFSFFSLVAQF